MKLFNGCCSVISQELAVNVTAPACKINVFITPESCTVCVICADIFPLSFSFPPAVQMYCDRCFWLLKWGHSSPRGGNNDTSAFYKIPFWFESETSVCVFWPEIVRGSAYATSSIIWHLQAPNVPLFCMARMHLTHVWFPFENTPTVSNHCAWMANFALRWKSTCDNCTNSS